MGNAQPGRMGTIARLFTMAFPYSSREIRLSANTLAQRNPEGKRPYQLTVSAGIVDSREADDLDGLLAAAGAAMYREKRAKHRPL